MNKLLKLVAVALLAAATVASLAACDTPDDPATDTSSNQTATPGDTSATPNGTTADNGSSGSTVDPAAAITLTFNGTQMTPSVSDSGVTVEGNAFVITRAGVYELKGDLSNGQVRVAVPKTDDVELILNNFTASCSTTAPLYIASANKAVINLAAGSVNSLTDGTMYEFPAGEDKPNACLYSSDDMTIEGSGTLNVVGKYNNGIGCKNDLRIKEGTVTVSAPNNIIKGNDSVEIEAATLTLTGGEDAIKSDTTDRTDKGYILITAGAKIAITCSDDALQATNSITVEAGATVSGQSGGDALNCPGTINADTAAMQVQSATQP